MGSGKIAPFANFSCFCMCKKVDSFQNHGGFKLYQCSLGGTISQTLETLLMHKCQAVADKCLVYLFDAIFLKKYIQAHQSVFASRLQPFP